MAPWPHQQLPGIRGWWTAVVPAGWRKTILCPGTGNTLVSPGPGLQGDVKGAPPAPVAGALGHKDRDLATPWGALGWPSLSRAREATCKGSCQDGPAAAAAPAGPDPLAGASSWEATGYVRGTFKVHCRPRTGCEGPGAAVTPVAAAGVMAELRPGGAAGVATRGPGEGLETCARWAGGKSFRDHASPSTKTLTSRGCGRSLHWG